MITLADGLLGVAELAEVPVSLGHLRHVDPRTRILIGYWLDVTAETQDPAITLRFDQVPYPDAPGRFWGAMRRDRP